MFKFIHTADIHLDSPLKGLESYEDAPVDEIRGATRRAFDQLVDFALDQEIDFILIAGDLYDGDWKDYNTGLFFVSRMAKLAKAGIRVFIIAGNHDAASRITKSMPLPENVTLFSSKKTESVVIDELKVVIHGRSYHTRSESTNLALTYPTKHPDYFNIALLHTSLTGRVGHENYAPCNPSELLNKEYEYWALGHVHKKEIVSEDPLIIFPGNLQGRHIRETGPKGATLITVEDGTVVNLSNKTFDVVRWETCDIDLSSCQKPEDIHLLIRESFTNLHDQAGDKVLALRANLIGCTTLHSHLLERKAQWTEECKAIATGLGEIWLEKMTINTTSPENHLQDIDENTVLGTLLQAINTMQIDDDSLQELLPELTALKNKLPADLNQESFSTIFIDEENPDSLKDEIRELLVASLLHRVDS